MSKKEPIRIAQIIGKWVGGGVEAVVMNYYRNLDRDKIQFDFICDEDSTNIPYEEIESLGGRIIIIPPYQKPIKYHFELKKVLKEGKYKIVHSHINTMSFFSLFAAKMANIPIRIAHSHSTTHSKEKLKNFLKTILKNFSKIFATDYYCCSEAAGRYQFGNKSFDDGKVTIINNAINEEKYIYNEIIRRNKRKELNIKDNEKIIGHIGRFVSVKNHEFLVEIFNELIKKEPNAKLVLAGQGPLEENIKKKVKELGIEQRVMFLGQRTDANELYQAFDVFVLPSLYEGLAVVGIEAQAAGLTCILSDEITKEVKILNSTEFLSLSASPQIWTLHIIKALKNERKNCQKEIIDRGFCIKKEAIELEKKYISMIKR